MTDKEARQLTELLYKMKFPVPEEVFCALCENLIMCSTELAVLRRGERGLEILLTYRNDRYFKGWHITGTILLPGDTFESGANRVIKTEVKQKVTTPEFIDHFMAHKGTGDHEYMRGQVFAHLFKCFLKEEYKGKGTFFPLDQIPEDTLPAHMYLISLVRKSTSVDLPKRD